jgi:hypothetical protein
MTVPPVAQAPLTRGTAGAHIHGQILLGVVVTAYLSVRFLLRSF